MIYAVDNIKTVANITSVSVTADMELNSFFLTNISVADIILLTVGMKVVHEKLRSDTKIINVYADSVELSRSAEQAEVGATIYAGKGLDICFREIETEESITLERWAYLDTVEGQMQQYPAIEIIGNEIYTEYLDEDSPDTRAWDRCNIDIWIIYAGNDSKTVNNWILYCREAIKRLINLDNTFGDLFEKVMLVSADLSEMFQLKERNDFLQYIIQGIEAKETAIY